MTYNVFSGTLNLTLILIMVDTSVVGISSVKFRVVIISIPVMIMFSAVGCMYLSACFYPEYSANSSIYRRCYHARGGVLGSDEGVSP